jgi:hypothetical protein
MITIKKFGRVAKVSAQDWANIKRRFDPGNAELIRDMFVIRIPCSLCKRYYSIRRKEENRCGDCPLRIFQVKGMVTEGCLRVLNSVADTSVVSIQLSRVEWYIDRDNYARKYFAKLQKAFKGLEKA